jgi:hypothetical protein
LQYLLFFFVEYEKLRNQLDKTKKELAESIQDNILLDGKLRQAQDRIARFLNLS